MIKCKEEGCPNGYDICCYECTEVECDVPCGNTKEEVTNCEKAIYEGSTELEVFENRASLIIKEIAFIADKKKQLEEDDKKMREQLEKAMEAHGIKSFENDLIKITYVEPTTRTSVDSKKLKMLYPEAYTKCSKTTEVKGSVRITVK